MSSSTRAGVKLTRGRWIAPVLLFASVLAGCGNNSEAGEERAVGAAANDQCENYPSKDVRLLVPYKAGGGFDAWARLIAPVLEEKLGGKGNVVVENQPGGGGMRAVNQVFSAEPDGSTIVYTEPGYIAVNQVLGDTPSGFDVTKLTYLGQVTADPQVFAVRADSAVNSVEDLAGRQVKHAGQDISPIETITYEAYGVKADYILHEGTSDVVLAVQRGDADAAVASLSSILDFLKSGDLKPILYIGVEEITPDLLGYEQLKGVATAADTGHPELNQVLEQHRVLAAPPGLPDCIRTKLADALGETLADPEFVERATEADLRIVHGTADEATDTVAKTYSTFEEYKSTLEAALEK
jgi:tripartite-type tricarboxylate transporter receptor subunit TctC